MPGSFNLYKIPPDWPTLALHSLSSKVFSPKSEWGQECPCCGRRLGSQRIPLCEHTYAFINISQEISLFFSYIKTVICLLVMFALALLTARYLSKVEPISFEYSLPGLSPGRLELGWVEERRWVRFIFFLLWSVLVLIGRGIMKKNKKEVKQVVSRISNRSVMLTNVETEVSRQDLLEAFEGQGIQKVVFTYRVQQYIQCLQQIYKLKKQQIVSRRKGASQEVQSQLREKVKMLRVEAEDLLKDIHSPNNRLDFVFITFRRERDQELFLAKYKSNLLGRLWFKLCCCCSPTSINGQHINVLEAPDPEDIDWLSLQAGYWTKKVHRMACYYMCAAILIFGVMFQYQITILLSQNFYLTIAKTGTVFAVNFLIITLLEHTTYAVEKHETKTAKVLSLVKKLTFFIFVNLSMSPLVLYVQSQFINPPEGEDIIKPIDQLCFSVLVISVGNLFKPLLQYLSGDRVSRWLGEWWEKRKGEDCELTQEEAHQAFEPIPYPIAAFYSLLLSGMLFTTFFLSCFQYLLTLQILACLLLFGVAKYMLLRICREPIGLSHSISILCQRLLTFNIYSYWVGEKAMRFFLICNKTQTFKDYVQDYSAFDIIQLAILVLIYFGSAKALAVITNRLVRDNEFTESFIKQANENANRMTYEDVNAVKRVEEEYRKFFAACE